MFKLLIGRNIFVRTTMHVNTGLLTNVTDKTITLENAVWIANTGKWSGFCNEAKATEIEPFSKPIIMGRETVMEYGEFPGPVSVGKGEHSGYAKARESYRSSYVRAAPEQLPVVHTDATYTHLLGKRVSVRGVTMVNTGTLVAVTDDDFILSNADWITNTGKWSQFIFSGRGHEVEQYGPYYVAVTKQQLVEITEIPSAPWPNL